MKTRRLTGSPVVAVMGNKLHSRLFSNNMCILKLKQSTETSLSDLLNRRWALDNPESKINKISLLEMKGQLKKASPLTIGFSNNTIPSLGDHMVEKREQGLSFYVVRDDLLHPLINGNKARKLDALLPLVQDHWVSDLVTCGGCQSAHAAAVAVSCAERGVRSHLLLRGEKPEVPTGYNLISSMYGNVTYIERSLYAQRKEMLMRYAELVAGNSGSVVWLSDILETSFAAQKSGKQILQGDYYGSSITQIEAANSPKRVVIVNEGAGDTVGLFGIIRLTKYLSQNHLFGKGRPLKVVVDAGTGTTAIGLGLGVLSLRLPWEIHAVMLADTLDGYKKQEERLIFDFKRLYGFEIFDNKLNAGNGGIVNWVDRVRPRKFGNVLKGEVEACQHIAQQTGILVDPVYTLAAWEHATLLCQKGTEEAAEVVMLHTGGTLGMFGLAQRTVLPFKLQSDFVGQKEHKI